MQKRYTGELARRLPAIDWSNATTGEEAGRLSDEDFDRKFAKLMLLFEHFGLEKPGQNHRDALSAFLRLALILAESHVPGFQEAKQVGRPRVWTNRLRMRAAAALGRLSAQFPRENQTKLATRLMKEPAWQGLSRTPTAFLRQVRMLNTAPREELAGLDQERPVNRLLELLIGHQPGGHRVLVKRGKNSE